MTEIDPDLDGVEHINVYSKGKTLLGRDLTNFATVPFYHPTYGKFNTIEGLWYYLRLHLLSLPFSTEERDVFETLRVLDGYKCKRLGKDELKRIPPEAWEGFPEVDFRAEIKLGIESKLEQNDEMLHALLQDPLPLVHYYCYGKPGKWKVQPAGNQWVIDHIEFIRARMRYNRSKAFVFRVTLQSSPEEPPVKCVYSCAGNKVKEAAKLYWAIIHRIQSEGYSEAIDRQLAIGDTVLKEDAEKLTNLKTFVQNHMVSRIFDDNTIRPITKLEVVNEFGYHLTSYFNTLL